MNTDAWPIRIRRVHACQKANRHTADMSKYSPVGAFLQRQTYGRIAVSFDEFASLVDGGLPASAYEYAAWWSNETNGNHVQARGWMGVGWRVASVDLPGRYVTFERST